MRTAIGLGFPIAGTLENIQYQLMILLEEIIKL